MDLPFSPAQDGRGNVPLAERVRPTELEHFLGQNEIVGPETLLRRALEGGELRQSMILWGPPGCGKTTLARLIAARVRNRFVPFSAVTSGIADVRRVVAESRKLRNIDSAPVILFVDEIHRFNKAQQDAFLPHIEDGTIVFIGATTENPSFEVIGPLLSRSRVFVLNALNTRDVVRILDRALSTLTRDVEVGEGVLEFIADQAQGDARIALNALDYTTSMLGDEPRLTREMAQDALQKRIVPSDKSGESHYNLISALHKSMRGGDADASLYYLARMCEAGEDPLYIARRLVRFASEDVGNADPHALSLAVATKDAVAFVGYPECKLALAQCVIYLALAPSSNSVYTAYARAAAAVNDEPPHSIPLHIRNAPTRLMKDLGYGKDYVYTHDAPEVEQEFLPEKLAGRTFYMPEQTRPGERTRPGFEEELARRIAAFRKKRAGGSSSEQS